MSEIAKNLFGQYKLYESPTLNNEQKVVVNQVLNALADWIQSELPKDEFIKEVSNKRATIQYVVGYLQSSGALTGVVDRVDGKTIAPLLDVIIDERIANYPIEGA